MTRRLLAATTVALTIAAAEARAADPMGTLAPAQSQLALVFRGADSLADVLDDLESRFGKSRNLARTLARLRAYEAQGIKPFARAWGPGLAPGNGVGLFAAGDGPRKGWVRFVIGVTDAAAAQQTLKAHLESIDATVEQVDGGWRIMADIPAEGEPPDPPFLCTERLPGFLVCDQGEVPTASSPPSWWNDAPVPTDGLLAVRLVGEPLAALTEGQPVFEAMWVAFGRGASGSLDLTIELAVSPLFSGPLGVLKGGEGDSRGLSLVDARSAGLLKLAFDGPALLRLAESVQAGGVPEPIRPLWAALSAHWTGDIVLSFDGGISHPVLMLGLQSPAGGQAVVESLAAAFVAEDAQTTVARVEPSATRDGVQVLTLENSEENIRVHLHHAVVGNALVFGLSPADVARRVSGGHRPARIDPRLRASGVHGMVARAMAPIFLVPWIGEVLSAAEAVGWIADAQIILAAIGYAVEEAGFLVKFEDSRVRMTGWWRTL
jgi:hypothetical protein